MGGPGDSRTLEIPQPCVPSPVGYKAPCPMRGFEQGCVVQCGDTAQCEECYNNTEKTLITPTAEACQAACVKDPKCAAFQWIGVGGDKPPTLHHQCLLKCDGAVTAGREQCSLGHPMGTGGGAFVCGPKVNNSDAPPSPKPPASTAAKCPVPFGLTGGSLEPGTDHARAGNTGSSVHELTCKPWCLFVRATRPSSVTHAVRL